MDLMKIESKFLTGIISKVLRKVIKKQTGCNIMLNLKNIDVKPNSQNGDGYLFSINVSGEIANKDVDKIICSFLES